MGADSSVNPLALKIVSATFVLSGILAAFKMFSGVFQGHISINLGVLAIPVGVGLLRHKHIWRVYALVFACLGIICAPLIGIALLVADQQVRYSGFGQAGTLSLVVAVAFAVFVLVISAWQYWVLTRPHIRRLFVIEGNAA